MRVRATGPVSPISWCFTAPGRPGVLNLLTHARTEDVFQTCAGTAVSLIDPSLFFYVHVFNTNGG